MGRFALIFILSVSLSATAQKSDFVGLYGDCDGGVGGYICQQFQLKSDSTFEFYDLLHLRGWEVSHGRWTTNKDTVILNSNERDIRIKYVGSSKSDSVTLEILVDEEPSVFSSIVTDTIYVTDTVGRVKIPKQLLGQCLLQTIGVKRTMLEFDQQKMTEASEVMVKIDSKSLELHEFDDTKWLFRNSKLYHTQDSLGRYEEYSYFEKVPLEKLKYHGKRNN